MLSVDLCTKLFAFAQFAAPQEMCGLLFDEDVYLSCENKAKDPEHAFLIAHEDYLHACMWMGKKPVALVHSHPTKGAGASVKDCKLMDALTLSNLNMVMVIVGLHPKEIRVFEKREHVYACIAGHIPAEKPLTVADVKKIRDALSSV